MEKKSSPEFDVEKKEAAPLYAEALVFKGYRHIPVPELGKGVFFQADSYIIEGKEYLWPHESHALLVAPGGGSIPPQGTSLPEAYHAVLMDSDAKIINQDQEGYDKIVEQIKTIAKRNKEIEEARRQHAKELSGGNAILEEVLERHMDFENGDINEFPEIENGITLYQIGRNASCDFYIGTKDGKKYKLSTCEAGDGKPWSRHFNEVENFDGYSGHY